MAGFVVGVTGGIGSGKSAVCTEFERHGIEVVDADIVAREVVVPGSPGLASVVEHFGSEVLNPDGSLDRAALRNIVFSDPEKREELESISKPMIEISSRAENAWQRCRNVNPG